MTEVFVKEEVQLAGAREIVTDEDVLSYSLRAGLEQVGSATGFLLAFALLFAMLPHAGRMRAGLAGKPARPGAVDVSAAASRSKPSEGPDDAGEHRVGAEPAAGIEGARG